MTDPVREIATNCRICGQVYRVANLPPCPYGNQGPCWCDEPRQRAAGCTAPRRREQEQDESVQGNRPGTEGRG